MGFGVGLGDVEGDAASWTAGATPGADLLELPFQDSATDPPSGTLSASTPWLEYVQLPDFPSDHHTPQYASVGGVFTHGSWSSAGLPSTRHTNPGWRCTRVSAKPAFRELRGGCLPGAAGVAHLPEASPELVVVDDDGDAVPRRAGRGLSGRDRQGGRRRAQEERGDEASSESHDQPARQAERVRLPSAGAAWAVARRHWSRSVMPSPWAATSRLRS